MRQRFIGHIWPMLDSWLARVIVGRLFCGGRHILGAGRLRRCPLHRCGLPRGRRQRVEDRRQVGFHIALILRQILSDLRLVNVVHADMRQPLGHVTELFIFARPIHKFALTHKTIDTLHQLAHITALLVEVIIAIDLRRTGTQLLLTPFQQALRFAVIEVIAQGAALVQSLYGLIEFVLARHMLLSKT